MAYLKERKWDTLIELNLTSNKIGDEGVEQFSSFVGIKKLILEDCGIT